LSYNNYNYNNNQSGSQASDLFPSLWTNEDELERATSSCLARVFLRMLAALLVTALAAFATISSDAMLMFVFGNGVTFIGLIILEIVLVIAISAGINRMSSTTASMLFFLYAIINGITLSVIFFAYELGIIYHAFAISALMFAAMAIYGTVTRKDLTSIGSLCTMGLFGIIIASIVNMIFLRSEMLEIVVSYVGVLVFVGLTAFHTQRIKKNLRSANADSQMEAIQKISVLGALTLYLDFINLFLKMLRILGRRR